MYTPPQLNLLTSEWDLLFTTTKSQKSDNLVIIGAVGGREIDSTTFQCFHTDQSQQNCYNI